jgi:Citrate lyase beta subunit
MAFGAGDYTLDMNMEWTLAESELEHARAEMAVASRAAGLEAPIDTVWVHINDLEGLASSAKRAKQLGFQGKMCIYPPQVEPVNRAFTPTEKEIAFARRVVAAFEKASVRAPRRSSWTASSSTTRSSTRRNAPSTPYTPPKR